jgi:hypothetical protein
MIATTLIAMLIILAMLAGWIGVQALHRRFTERHPEMGLATDSGEAGGCGLFCLCKNGFTCPKQKLKSKSPDTRDHL